jgi:LmbE family N-acetylglucosaminyl deacetylase
MMKSVLVVAAHPDDEVLGCGGTIASLTNEGSNVNVAFLADGVMSRGETKQDQNGELNSRRAAAKKACDILGVESVCFRDFPDNQMDTIALLDIVKEVESLIEQYQPDTILTHHFGDLNVDHRATNQAVITACRPQQDSPVKTILSFEVPSSTEWQLAGNNDLFNPNWFVNITDTLETKLSALDVYASELRDWPHPRSRNGVECLARWRGATVSMNAAEAFMLRRHIK